MILLNGGHMAFQQQMERCGPSELIKNLKNVKFIQTYGKINVAECIFEYPYGQQKEFASMSHLYGLDSKIV